MKAGYCPRNQVPKWHKGRNRRWGKLYVTTHGTDRTNATAIPNSRYGFEIFAKLWGYWRIYRQLKSILDETLAAPDRWTYSDIAIGRLQATSSKRLRSITRRVVARSPSLGSDATMPSATAVLTLGNLPTLA